MQQILSFSPKYFPEFLKQEHIKLQHLKQEQVVACSHRAIKELLLQQWKKLTPLEIEKTRFRKRAIAMLIESKYGVDRKLTENYLSNIERTLPQVA